MAVPRKYRQGGSDFQFNVDYFDYISGVGYKAFYLAGGADSSGLTYFLTTNSTIISDTDNNQILTTGGSFDLDFDIDVTRTFYVADNIAIVKALVRADTSSTFRPTWTIYHVDKDGNETSIGSTIGRTYSGSAGAELHIATTEISTTKKKFVKNEKLRLNIVGLGGSNFDELHFDPSGFWTITEGSNTYTKQSFVLLPIEVIR